MPRGIPKNVKLSPKCPPLLRQLIEQEGSRKGAAHASKTGTTTIAKISDGVLEMTDAQRTRILAALKDAPHTSAEAPPIAIPPWDGKAAVYKYTTMKGKVTIKNMPLDLTKLVKQNGGNLNNTSKILGYSSWTAIRTILERDAYEIKLHDNVYRALNGIPIKSKVNGHSEPDTAADYYQTGFAVCIISLAEYERIEAVAEILGGVLVTKMSAGSVWIVIYRLNGRDKLEKFKKVAGRDAKKIVCP